MDRYNTLTHTEETGIKVNSSGVFKLYGKMGKCGWNELHDTYMYFEHWWNARKNDLYV